MAVDLGVVIGDGLLASGTVVAAVFARRAVRAGRHNAEHLHEQDAALERIEQNTDARQDDRIKLAVEQVAREHPGLFGKAIYDEALRDLLDAFIGAQMSDAEYESAHERRGRPRHPDNS